MAADKTSQIMNTCQLVERYALIGLTAEPNEEFELLPLASEKALPTVDMRSRVPGNALASWAESRSEGYVSRGLATMGIGYFTFEPKELDTVAITLEPDAHGQQPGARRCSRRLEELS